MLRYPVPFSTIFNFHNRLFGRMTWSRSLDASMGSDVAVDVLGDAPQNLGVVHYASDIDDVIRLDSNHGYRSSSTCRYTPLWPGCHDPVQFTSVEFNRCI
jgi:hypothetical protein